ncbi:hypothetical protein SAMN02745121_05158 [Nannocystis exedens]|uniref:Uncharacterized protein n=1 Tax=Nannocystis exedens TaxID=54 RepID=A0A1I2CJZ4_9BACT|nr:hypothetical protein [Nannocystis exedens]PCC68274.1 hypothetical protein NAEX_01284 [Nannocystis exedens]SFE68030.1 hypothetical protein SAMN02745121_05158 [Nannocystis exedens]
MLPILHIHAGDCAAGFAREIDLEGEVLGWRDSAAVGPCSRERGRHVFLRMAFWQTDLAEIQRAEELPTDCERVLWFGPDPWEQLQLVELLAYMSDGPCSIVPLSRAVTELTRSELHAAFAARRNAESLRFFAAALWFDFCDNDPAGIALRLRRAANDQRLPHLGAAIRRVLQDRNEHRTEREIENLVRSGVWELPALLEALRARELPAHGAWYGDVVVGRLRDACTMRMQAANDSLSAASSPP